MNVCGRQELLIVNNQRFRSKHSGSWNLLHKLMSNNTSVFWHCPKYIQKCIRIVIKVFDLINIIHWHEFIWLENRKQKPSVIDSFGFFQSTINKFPTYCEYVYIVYIIRFIH